MVATTPTPKIRPDVEAFLAKQDFRSKFREKGLSQVQRDAISNLVDKHGSRSANAVNLPTGVGKTAIGLVYAKWCLEEEEEQVAFLCQNKALVDQAIDEAALLKVPVAPIHGREHYSTDAEARAAVDPYIDGAAIGVFSYSSYLRGRYTQSAQTIIVDDAHQLRQHVASFRSLEIDNDGTTQSLYSALTQLLSQASKYLGDPAVAFQDSNLQYEERFTIIPFATVWEKRDQIAKTLNEFVEKFPGTERKPDAWYKWPQLAPQLQSTLCVITPETLIFRPFSQSMDSMLRYQGGPIFPQSSQIVLMTATLGPPTLFAELLGLARPVQEVAATGELNVTDRTGHRAIVPMADKGAKAGVNTAVANTIAQIAEHHPKLLFFVQSKNQARILQQKLGARVRTRVFERHQDMEDFLTDEQLPVGLFLISREGGVDVADQRCRVGVHVQVPVITDPFDHIRDQILEDREFLALNLAQRMTQAFGRLNRRGDNRSVHYVLDDRYLERLYEKYFGTRLDFNAFIDSEVGRRGWATLEMEPMLAAAQEFLQGSGPAGTSEAREKAIARYRRLRAQVTAERDRPVAEILEAWESAMGGGFDQAAVKFRHLAEKTLGEGRRAQSAFFRYFQSQFTFLADTNSAAAKKDAAAALELGMRDAPAGIRFFNLMGRVRSKLLDQAPATDTEQDYRLWQGRRIFGRLQAFAFKAQQEFPDEPNADQAAMRYVGERLGARLLSTTHDEMTEALNEMLLLFGFEAVHTEYHGVDVVAGTKEHDGYVAFAIEAKVDAKAKGESTSAIEDAAPEQTHRKAEELQSVAAWKKFFPSRPLLITNRPKGGDAVDSAAKKLGVWYCRRHFFDQVIPELAGYLGLAVAASAASALDAQSLFIRPRELAAALEPTSGHEIDGQIVAKLFADRAAQLQSYVK